MKKIQTLGKRQRRAMIDRFKVASGKNFDLGRFKTDETMPDIVSDKKHGTDLLAAGIQRLSELQTLLYANSTWSLLLVFQAMDAAGKDSTIAHVMSGVNPQGVSVVSFKQPGPEELAHDYLWRISRALPARGLIGIFNRSHYEEVLVARVHPEIIQAQHLPPSLVDGEHFWDHRIEDIAAFERHLSRQGTRILKFFLNVSKDEQKRRFFDRLDEPAKNWKFSAADVVERGFWDRYMHAYGEAIAGTATEAAPWFVVPADHKWFARLVVIAAITDALEQLDLKPVQVSDAVKKNQAEAKAKLEAEP
jgi:PPK2 family polyphosphate:nucleotide phosphotransferase